MDPDMVRQQAEAEREALALSQKKPVPSAVAHATLPGAAPVVPGEAPAFTAMMPIQEPAALQEAEASALQDEQTPRRTAFHAAAQIGRAISFGVAGAMLGGGLGILAASYMQLPLGHEKLETTARSAMTHHPHMHMIVPGGGLSADGQRWIACRPEFFLPVRVLSQLFRRLVLSMLLQAYGEGRLKFHGAHAALADETAFAAFLAPLWRCEWVVYPKKSFGGSS
jgi:hypothetical protein